MVVYPTVYELKNKKYNEAQLTKYARYFRNEHWLAICQYQTLTEEFMVKFENHLYWILIGKYQILSEAFMINYKKKLWIIDLAQFQVFSTFFAINFGMINYINAVKSNKKMTLSQKQEIIDNLNMIEKLTN